MYNWECLLVKVLDLSSKRNALLWITNLYLDYFTSFTDMNFMNKHISLAGVYNIDLPKLLTND